MGVYPTVTVVCVFAGITPISHVRAVPAIEQVPADATAVCVVEDAGNVALRRTALAAMTPEFEMVNTVDDGVFNVADVGEPVSARRATKSISREPFQRTATTFVREPGTSAMLLNCLSMAGLSENKSQ